MIRYTVSTILFILLACIIQQFIPPVTHLYHARLLILPLSFLCISVTVGIPTMLSLAFLCGFLWDAQHTLALHPGAPDSYPNPTEPLHFGYSILLYGAMGFLMQGIQPLFQKGKWPISSLLTGIATFLYLLTEYLLINFIRGDITFPSEVLYRIYITSALSMIASPLIFAALFKLADITNHTILYQGLKKSPKYRTINH